MNKIAVADLIAEIDKALQITARNNQVFEEFYTTDLPLLGRKTTSAMIFSQIMSDYYTALETMFFRISQFFENHLRPAAWHKELLEKMTLAIEDVRIPVISQETFVCLSEILRFRHFRRYYFEYNYDWDRLDLVEKKYRAVRVLLTKDLETFKGFLRELQKNKSKT